MSPGVSPFYFDDLEFALLIQHLISYLSIHSPIKYLLV